MKKNLIFLLTVILGGLITVSSCKKDDDDPIIIDNPIYGMQVIGTATGGEAYVIDVKQTVEPSSDFATKVTQDGMYYGIYYLTAGEIGFANVTAEGEVAFGATGAATTQDAEAGEEFSFIYGDLAAGGTGTVAIATAGLYYIMTDEVNSKFWVMQINNFEINSTGDKAVLTSGSSDGATFEVSGVALTSAFKLRMNTAWKIIAEDIPYTGAGGADGDHARAVTSYGGAIDNLTPEGSDIEIDNGGKLLDFTITWNPAKKGIAGITIATADGGDLPKTDWSVIKLEVVGSAVSTDNANAIPDPSWSWGNVLFSNNNTGVPTQVGDVYTYTWSSVVFEAQLDAADADVNNQWRIVDEGRMQNVNYSHLDLGTSSANVIDVDPDSGDRNMAFLVKGTYNIVLNIDAADADAKTLIITEVVK